MNPDRIIALRSTLTVFRDCDRCLKVFGAEHTQSSVLREAFNAASAAEAGVCTPRVLGVTELDGMPTIVSEFVKGKTLAAIASEQGSVHGCLERFAREHALVNSFAAPMLRSEKDAAAEGILRSGLPQGQIAVLLAQNAAAGLSDGWLIKTAIVLAYTVVFGVIAAVVFNKKSRI